jgi:HK97 family phage portal protein
MRPTLPARARAALKMLFGGYGGTSWQTISGDLWGPGATYRTNSYLPNTRRNYSSSTDPLWLNAVVSIALTWICDNFIEPELQLKRRTAKAEEDILSHPLLTLLEEPNPEYDGDTLWAATVVSWCVDGNAYWKIERTRGGAPGELWFIPHFAIAPRWDADGRSFITHYEYNVSGERQRFEKEDVIHFRDRMDLHNIRSGMPRLRPLLREIESDNEIATYTAAILRNMGIPGAIASPKDKEIADSVDQPMVDKLRAQWRELLTGEGQGQLIVADGFDYTFPDASPERMALDIIAKRPETRVCAALRIPPIVLNLQTGLERSTYSNYEEARVAAYRDCLFPLQTTLARKVARQLLPEYDTDPRQHRLRWDYSQVLQPDQDKLWARVGNAVTQGLLTINEGREELGKGPLEGGDETPADRQERADQISQQEPPESAGDRAAREGREEREQRPNPNGKSLNGWKHLAAHDESTHGRRRGGGTAGGATDTGAGPEKTPAPKTKSEIAKQTSKRTDAKVQRYSEEHNEPYMAQALTQGRPVGEVNAGQRAA